jgi:uncharacterized protein with PIN domain
MIVDTSALLAVLLDEPEAQRFASAMESAPVLRISAASYVEAAIYVDRNLDEVRRAMLDTFLAEFSIGIAGAPGAPGFRSFRQGPAQGGIELRGLLQLRAGQGVP